MKLERAPTSLEYAILGLLSMRPQTGYEIGRAFAETPIAIFSSSPGAIYPALKRLIASGLVESVSASPTGARARCAITKKGGAAFRAWLKKPVTRVDVAHGMAELMLRFAFMSGALPDAAIREFLARMKEEIDNHARALAAYARDARPMMTPTGNLALEAGIESYRDRARWAERAIALLGRDQPLRQPEKSGAGAA